MAGRKVAVGVLKLDVDAERQILLGAGNGPGLGLELPHRLERHRLTKDVGDATEAVVASVVRRGDRRLKLIEE